MGLAGEGDDAAGEHVPVSCRQWTRQLSDPGHEERLGADRHEPAGQERPQRGRIAGRYLGEHRLTRLDQSLCLGDQPAAQTGRSDVTEAFDRHLEPPDQAGPERDEARVVAEDPYIDPVSARPGDAGMVVEIGAYRKCSTTGSSGDQHRVVRTDRSAGSGEPSQHIRLIDTTETVGAAGAQLVRIPIGQHDRVACELDDRMVAAPLGAHDLHGTVDTGKAILGGCQQQIEQPVHHPDEARDLGARGYGSRMRVDVMTVPESLRDMGAVARRTQAAGFDGMLLTEGARSVYPAAAAAALAVPELEYSTGVAVAFPRSPMVTAQSAWELQEATGGRFRLGLGTQVRTHVVRRYGVEFDHPGPRLRDYVRAVKACFAGFRGEALDHHGDFYELTFLNRQWSPGPIGAPDPPVDVAAVNPWMLRMAGEVADGVHVHPLGEPGYLRRHVLPQVAAGASASGRTRDDLSVVVPVLTVVGDNDEEISRSREAARFSLSFYGSTPNYGFIWDEAGFEGTTDRIRAKQKGGDFAGMAAEVTDDHLAAFTTEASWDGLADALISTYGDIADRLAFYSPMGETPERFDRYGAVARAVSDRTT